MNPLDTSGMGALRVEASIFGESALIDRVCCDVVVFVKVSALSWCTLFLWLVEIAVYWLTSFFPIE